MSVFRLMWNANATSDFYIVNFLVAMVTKPDHPCQELNILWRNQPLPRWAGPSTCQRPLTYALQAGPNNKTPHNLVRGLDLSEIVAAKYRALYFGGSIGDRCRLFRRGFLLGIVYRQMHGSVFRGGRFFLRVVSRLIDFLIGRGRGLEYFLGSYAETYGAF